MKDIYSENKTKQNKILILQNKVNWYDDLRYHGGTEVMIVHSTFAFVRNCFQKYLCMQVNTLRGEMAAITKQ